MSNQLRHYLHSRHDWTGEPELKSVVGWTAADPQTRTDTIVVEDIRQCLMLKLAGFVESQNAQIQDVSEDHLHLQFGGSWLKSLLNSEATPLGIEIRLRPVPTSREETTGNRLVEVEVVIHDRRWRKDTSRFEKAARRVMMELRDHLMAVR